MGAIFGGGQSAQRKAAEDSRKQQAVANDRQLAAMQVEEQRDAPTRRNPRGRRLFVDQGQKTDLS